jgi:hypothetical protein
VIPFISSCHSSSGKRKTPRSEPRVLELHIFFFSSSPSLSEKTADGTRAREVDDSNGPQVVEKEKKEREREKRKGREINSREEFSNEYPSPAPTFIGFICYVMNDRKQ